MTEATLPVAPIPPVPIPAPLSLSYRTPAGWRLAQTVSRLIDLQHRYGVVLDLDDDDLDADDVRECLEGFVSGVWRVLEDVVGKDDLEFMMIVRRQPVFDALG